LYFGDALGTSRQISFVGDPPCYDADYFPWGAEQEVYTNTCPTSQNYKFTGKERDPDMGVDYFGARFYEGAMGRFYSPDWSASPEPVPYSKLDNPQSLNLYSFTKNNPLSNRDLDGHDPQTAPAGVNLQSWSSPSVKDKATEVGASVLNFVQSGSDWLQANPYVMFVPSLAEMVETGGAGGSQNVQDVVEEVAGSAESKIGGAVSASEQMLTRYGTEAESTLEKLSGDAAKAEAHPAIGIHGVSVTSSPKPTLPGGSAPKSAVEQLFNVFKTGGAGHFTVELPKPVTDSVVKAFNSLFFK
jgi:RHS repeat-associated protein